MEKQHMILQHNNLPKKINCAIESQILSVHLLSLFFILTKA
ncbi:hypothetical protein X560_2726 [Listeria fleischmannii 1991]|uniref:Uncharacterized protein n=1 Tax=Listeria fleischmannii 1991 TaxID=1430899 RepID=A0A0J8GA84_9LIST|nr:hypothetical protein X560_2726 [Listeria fleischmannii 1991]